MKRLFILLTALLLLVGAACSSPESTGTDNGGDEGDKSGDENQMDDNVAAGTALAGDWEGKWKNTTFGSEGSVVATVTVDEAAKTITIVFDSGGNVFGESDPDPITVTASLDGRSEFTGDVGIYGKVTVDFDWDKMTFTIDAPDVPSAGIKSVKATGQIVGNKITAAADISFPDGTSAKSTFELTKK